MSENAKLAEALVAFQAVVPPISKNRTAHISTRGGGTFTYRYADLGDIWDAIRGPLTAHGLAVTQSLSGGHSGWTGITTTVWHKSGQSISSTVYMPTLDRTPQEVGSMITYYKRYALAAILGISTEEDDDANVAQAAAQEKRPAPRKARPAPLDRTRQREPLTKLEDAKEQLREAIRKAGVPGDDYAWVKDATEEDIDTILGHVEALKNATLVSAES